jgi:hypothetical protein
MIQGKHGDINIKGEKPPSRPIKVESEYSAVDYYITGR